LAPQAPRFIFSTLSMAEPSRAELPIIEATLDLIRWFIPLLNRLPRSDMFALAHLQFANDLL
jgi:hypothetical protein